MSIEKIKGKFVVGRRTKKERTFTFYMLALAYKTAMDDMKKEGWL